MISHRSSVLLRVVLPFFGLALAACDRATDATQPALRSGTATFDKRPVPKGVISARVLTNKAGVSILEVRTGTFDNATNTGTPAGSFEKIEYTITQNDPGKKAKKIFDRNVTFERSHPTLFSEVINICQKTDENDPDEGDGHGYDSHGNTDKKPPLCPLQIGKSYSISIEADLEGVGGDDRNDVEVRDTAVFFNNPDIDLSAEKVQIVVTTNPSVTTDQLLATVDSATTYQVRFANSSTAIGIRITCEVHVFNSANTDVTPAGRTYRWIPNGRPAYDATKPGSVASDTTTIKPGEQAICQFKMKLGPTGSYRVVVTANAVYPDDYDPSNNKASGTVTIITGTPVLPPPGGGFGAHANADDFAFYGGFIPGTGGSPAILLDYRGDSAQTAAIDELSSTVVGGLTGTFTANLHFYTVDSLENLPATASRNLANATWFGSLATLAALAQGPGDHCVSSDAAAVGHLDVTFAVNGNVVKMIMCITQLPDSLNPPPNPPKYKISISVRWTPPTNPVLPVAAANGAVSYGDFIYFHVDLKFSDFTENPVAHAPVALNLQPEVSTPPATAFAFGARLRMRRYH
jgi:plastocyanin